MVSVSSEPLSDDDGHYECGKGGFHSCPDNPDNYYLRENEDPDSAVGDVLNTNQNLFSGGEDSVAKSSRFSNSVGEGSEEDKFESCESDGGDIDAEVTPGNSNEYPAPDEEKRSDSDNDCKP